MHLTEWTTPGLVLGLRRALDPDHVAAVAGGGREGIAILPGALGAAGAAPGQKGLPARRVFPVVSGI